MLSFIQELKDYKCVWSHGDVKIDTVVSALHHQVTVNLLLVFCGLVCSQQYFGEPIQCIQDVNSDYSSVPLRVMNNFCFVSSTYTLLSSYDDGELIPNLGPDFKNSWSKEVRRHAYYQWVPFVLFVQAISFSIPHTGWHNWEGGLLQGLLTDFKAVMPLKKQKKRLQLLAKYFLNRLNTHGVWIAGFIFCEVFNLINLIGNILVTHFLLGGYFFPYGIQLLEYFLASHLSVPHLPSSDSTIKNPTDVLFPKVTKCSFYKYGPSGTIQRHDSMCIMALNIVNEKIFAVLWFWFFLLFFVSSLMILWRLVSFLVICFFSRSDSGVRNRIIHYTLGLQSRPNVSITPLSKQFFFSDWMFLSFLAQNMTSNMYSEFIKELASLSKLSYKL